MFCSRRLLALILLFFVRAKSESVQQDHLASLLECRTPPNPHTQHLRIPEIVQNISQTPGVHRFNPTIVALPHWAENQYLLVSRVVTEGLHQESVLCEANICSNSGDTERREGEKDCPPDSGLGEIGGLYCATPPVVISVPPTPAEQCDGSWSAFPDIPGFHDPRIFWSGQGEPLIIVNSASQYACLGLWIADLRTLYEPLKELLASQPGEPDHHSSRPPIFYSQLTELTRNPASTRSAVEKNWFLFFPTPSTSYIHYDLSPPSPHLLPLPNPFQSAAEPDAFSAHSNPIRRATLSDHLPPANSTHTTTPNISGRTFAKLLRNGRTTTNLTSPLEQSCLTNNLDPHGQPGHWHQATNALKLLLCRRRLDAATCGSRRAVHFAIVHRKFSNIWDLPLRYERYFVVWDAEPPFRMRGVSKYPLLFWNETASGWTGTENWVREMEEGDLRLGAKDESGDRNGKRSLTQRTSMNGVDASMRNETRYPMDNTTNSTDTEDDDPWRLKEDRVSDRKGDNWAYFTYTPSIAWAWRPHSAFADGGDALESLNVGYLDDEVILGIGMDDIEQAFARAKAETLLQCLKACPGMDEGEEGNRQNVMLGFEREDEMMRQDTENRDFLGVYE